MKILLINANLFLGDPAVILKNQYLAINNGLIEDFGFMSNINLDLNQQEKIIDCKNTLVSPGLIDVHVHFRDPGYKFKEDIVSGSESAMAGGFTSVVCQPNTNPPLDNALAINYLKDQAKQNSKINIRFYASATKASAGKEIVSVQSLVNAGAVGFTDDGLPIANAKIMKDLLQYSALLDVPIAQHAEDLNLSSGGCVHHGSFAQKFSLQSIDPASEYSVIARDLALVGDIPNARYHVLHVSCEKSLEYIKLSKSKNLRVTAEITPHHFTVSNEILHEHWAGAKMNPPLRSEQDVKAMVDAMRDGTIDIIASDHAPHDTDSKEKPISCASFGIIGLETMLPLSLELYFKNLLTLERILEMLTVKPAQLINEHKRGVIKKNNIADLAIIDIDYEWVICCQKIKSKSINTPFDNRSVRGKGIATIVGGELVFSDKSHFIFKK